MHSSASLEPTPYHSLHQVSAPNPCFSLPPTSRLIVTPPISGKTIQPLSSKFPCSSRVRLPRCTEIDCDSVEKTGAEDDNDVCNVEAEEDGDGVSIEIRKTSRNSRRIVSRIGIDATLDTIWGLLTDYERLADFIPGLAVSELMEKRDGFARLYQIGQQDLAFGVKFNAKGILDCYEKDLECLPSGQKRDIAFKMIEGDFQVFEGKWSIEQLDRGGCEDFSPTLGQEDWTTLSYIVDVKPKLWLPVGLVEGRLCKEIKMNLICIRQEARRIICNSLPDLTGQENSL